MTSISLFEPQVTIPRCMLQDNVDKLKVVRNRLDKEIKMLEIHIEEFEEKGKQKMYYKPPLCGPYRDEDRPVSPESKAPDLPPAPETRVYVYYETPSGTKSLRYSEPFGSERAGRLLKDVADLHRKASEGGWKSPYYVEIRQDTLPENEPSEPPVKYITLSEGFAREVLGAISIHKNLTKLAFREAINHQCCTPSPPAPSSQSAEPTTPGEDGDGTLLDVKSPQSGESILKVEVPAPSSSNTRDGSSSQEETVAVAVLPDELSDLARLAGFIEKELSHILITNTIEVSDTDGEVLGDIRLDEGAWKWGFRQR